MKIVVFTRLANGNWVEGYAEGMSIELGFDPTGGPTLEEISQQHYVPYDLLHKAFVGGAEAAPAPVAQAEKARDLPAEEPAEEAAAEEAPKPRGRKKKHKD